MGGLLSALLDKLFSKNLDVVLVGLNNSGKTTFCESIKLGSNPKIQPAPTIGLNINTFKEGGIKFKVWDIGGTQQFRKEWPRYTRDADIIAFVIDIADHYKWPICRKELHVLLEDKELNGKPLLILANKIDLQPNITEETLIKELNLDYITDNDWIIIPISAKYGNNIDEAIKHLSKYCH